MLRFERARLERLFQRALLASLALPVAGVSCSQAESTSPATADAGRDPVDAADEGPCAPKLRDVSVISVDGSDQCEAVWEYQCGLPHGYAPVDGSCSFSLNDCQKLCPATGAYICEAAEASCPVTVGVDASVSLLCSFCPNGIGRRPRGLVEMDGPSSGSVLGDYFARAAELEAASVHAFEMLAEDLRAIGAPASLRTAARRAARDEVRHATMTSRLARIHGARRRTVRISKTPRRSERELSLENAAEGCVKETFGALVASFQARRAQAPRIARVMSVIARDEARHAALSWAIARFLGGRLDAAARLEIERTLEQTARAVEHEIAEPPAPLQKVAGLPNARQARVLFGELERSLWTPAV